MVAQVVALRNTYVPAAFFSPLLLSQVRRAPLATRACSPHTGCTPVCQSLTGRGVAGEHAGGRHAVPDAISREHRPLAALRVRCHTRRTAADPAGRLPHTALR
jgi:hypothetical protein